MQLCVLKTCRSLAVSVRQLRLLVVKRRVLLNDTMGAALKLHKEELPDFQIVRSILRPFHDKEDKDPILSNRLVSACHRPAFHLIRARAPINDTPIQVLAFTAAPLCIG